MLWLAATAIAASTPQGAPIARAGATAQSEARVRIVAGVTVRLGGAVDAATPRPRTAVVRTEGEPKRVRLIEFE